MEDIDRISLLIEEAQAHGAFRAGLVPVADIPFDRELRKACAANYCGNYGKNWTCPPDVGDIDAVIAQARGYRHALVYQTVTAIEDSYDWEGMVAAHQRHAEVTDRITEKVAETWTGPVLQLSAGGCPVCETCAKRDGKPCIHPDRALASLEAYGIHVAKLAALGGMKYINGQNTVTFFGAYLLGQA